MHLLHYDQVVKSIISGKIICSQGCNKKNSYIKKEINPVHFTPDELVKKKLNWAKHLFKLHSVMKKENIIEDFIVHGSFGDFTSTNFSDLELTVYLKDFYNSPNISKKIQRNIVALNKFIIEVDPLQHHGVFFVWNDLLDNYDESILPVCAYKKCWSFSGEKIPINILLDLNSVADKSLKKFMVTLKSLSQAENTFFKGGYSLFAVKRFISNLFMLPVYYFQSKGFNFSKKEAMRDVWRQAFPEKFFQALRLATAMRKNWPIPPRLLSCLRKAIVHYKIPQGPIDYILCSMFINNEISSMTKKELLPLVKSATNSIQRSV